MGGLRRAGARAGGGAVVGFPLTEVSGQTAALVGPEPPPDGRRVAALVRPGDRALVLASAQDDAVADHAALRAGAWSLARRRSGGGALVIVPGAQVWLDVFVPAGDPLALADVAAGAYFLGALWREALALSGVRGELAWHRGGVERSPFARVACFAALGPGEVTLDGRKVVGCAQRRTREGTWLHTMALLENHQGELVRLLALPPPEQEALAAALAGVGVVDVSPGALEQALAGLLAAR